MPAIHATHPVALRGEPSQIVELLERPGALLQGHFSLLAGMHTDLFFRFSAIAKDPAALDVIAAAVEPELKGMEIDSIMAPTTAGMGLGWTLATRLGVALHAAAVDDNGRPDGVIGEPAIDGARVLIVNDVVTTGEGLRAMRQLLEERGAQAAAGTWFLTRSSLAGAPLEGVPCLPVASWDLRWWGPAHCPACAAGDVSQHAYDLN